jgi:hypothetical protein
MEADKFRPDPEFDPISSRLNETIPFSAEELIDFLATEQIRQELRTT